MTKTLLLIALFSSYSFAGININELSNKLKQNHFKPLEYKKSRSLLFKIVDNKDGLVCSAYTPRECRKQRKSKNFNLNVEHTWPQSKGAKRFPAQGDMHHLYVTSKESNSKRANFPFCHVFESDWEKQGSMMGINDEFQKCFEPLDSHKGNVARAMFYFAIRYKKSIRKDQEILFRAWNLLDPVDEFEIQRNDDIECLQGNRNPFIDDETLINQIESIYFKI